MGWVHFMGRGPTRERLMRGELVAWVYNSRRMRYIRQVVLSTPPWMTLADRKQLLALHAQAQCLSEMTGVPHHLDHIVPLNHPRVCGLTVPWNIVISTAKVNGAKSNHWCPEQGELF